MQKDRGSTRGPGPAAALPAGAARALDDAGGAAPAGDDETGEAQAQWLHDLRNAMNTVTVTSMMVRRTLDAGSVDAAHKLARDLEQACVRCNALLHDPQSRSH